VCADTERMKMRAVQLVNKFERGGVSQAGTTWRPTTEMLAWTGAEGGERPDWRPRAAILAEDGLPKPSDGAIP
jgi:hypothetical protein